MYRKKAKPSNKEGFGNCTNRYKCQAARPKGITVDYIAKDEPRIPRRYRDLRRKGVREGLIVSKQWLVVRTEGP